MSGMKRQTMRRMVVGALAVAAFVATFAILWWKMDARPRTIVASDEEKILLAFSPDSQLLATFAYRMDREGGRFFGAVSVWLSSTGQKQSQLSYEHALDQRADGNGNLHVPLPKVGFAPDNEHIAVLIDDKTQYHDAQPLQVMDVQTGSVATRNKVRDFRFSLDGQLLAVIEESPHRTRQHQLLLLDVHSGRELATVAAETLKEGADDVFSDMTFFPDGLTFAFAHIHPRPSGAYTYTLWDIPTGRERRVISDPTDGKAEFVADKERFYSYQDPYDFAAFAPDGRTLATCYRIHREQVLKFWDLTTGQRKGELHLPLENDDPNVFYDDLVFSKDGSTVTAIAKYHGFPMGTHSTASPNQLDWVTTWDVPSQKKLSRYAGTSIEDPNRSFLPTRLLRWRQRSNMIDRGEIVDLVSGQVVFVLPIPGYLGDWCAWYTLSPDGRLFAVALPRGLVEPEFRNSESPINPQIAPPDAELNLQILCWDITTGQRLASVPCPKIVRQYHWWRDAPFLISPDNRTLAAHDPDGMIKLWDLPPRKPLAIILAWASIAPALVLLFPWWRGKRRKRAEGISCA